MIDDLSSGKYDFIKTWQNHERFNFVKHSISYGSNVQEIIPEGSGILLLASNPNINLAESNPSIDFDKGTIITNEVVEASRIRKSPFLIFTSGSGVYGERGEHILTESDSCIFPISTYASSKIAGESLICAYSKMFGIKSYVFRFGNVVGPRQTHGVTYDFVKQLKSGNGVLKVLGNGTQSKTYVHVTDVCKAIFKVLEVGVSENFSIHNVGSDSYITVKEIADLTIEKFNLLNKANISALYQETDRGWNGDVPVMRMSTAKIRKLGWDPKYTSSEALQDSINWLINNDF